MILHMDGFEGMGTTTGVSSASSIQTKLRRKYAGAFEGSLGDSGYILEQGETEGYALSMGNPALFSDTERKIIVPIGNQLANTVVVGMRFKSRNTSITTVPFIDFTTSSLTGVITVAQVRLFIVEHKHFQLRRGPTTVIDTSVTDVLTPGNWHHLEFKLKIHQSAGLYELRLDGVDIMSNSGLNTHHATDEIFDCITLPGIPVNDPTNYPFLIDDLYVLNNVGSTNNDFLGTGTKIRIFYPIADGSVNDFIPSVVGDNFETVNEEDPTNTEHNTGSDSGDIDLYVMDTVVSDNIHCVMTEAIVRQADEGVRSMRHVCKSGMTVSEGADVAISDRGDLSVSVRYLENDPDTTSPWTDDGINNAEFGVEVRS